MKRLAFIFCLFAAVAHAHTRGTDFSGDLSDAGGIGGLLARSDASGSVFYHADGSGNVTALIDGSENIIGRYLYNPFGKIIGQWGGKASANEMKFSSMPAYWFGGSGYWGRIWLQDQQRWANNDPTQEAGGNNMAAGMDNDPLNEIDPWGLWETVIDNGQGKITVFDDNHPNGVPGQKSGYNSYIPLDPPDPPDPYRTSPDPGTVSPSGDDFGFLFPVPFLNKIPIPKTVKLCPITRYMSKEEADLAKKTGKIPNVGRDNLPRPTHVTKDPPLDSASKAKKQYELPEDPTHRATVPGDRVGNLDPAPSGPKTSGGGSQNTTPKPIPVNPSEIHELGK